MHAWRFLWLIAAAHAFGHSANGATLARSVSSSRQFIVFGEDVKLRGGLCDFAERTKKNLLSVLYRPDGWKVPIVVYAQHRTGSVSELPPARLHFSQTGFGLKLQLDLAVAADKKPDCIGRELLRALLLELMYRDAPDTPAGTAYVQPPDWLIEGVLALSGERDSAAVAGSVAQLTGLKVHQPLADFIEQRPELLDSPSRLLFATRAAALVSMLTETPEAAARLSRFLIALPTSIDPPFAQLARFFPELTNAQEAQQKWSGALLRLAARERSQMLSCEQTEHALAELLSVELRDSDGSATTFSLEEFPQFIRSAAAPTALHEIEQRLSLLSARANLLYSPVILDYRRIVAELARRKTHRIPERLARLRGDREETTRRMSAIGDYVNWFEATQMRTASGAFADYMHAAESAAEKQPPRHDAISVYLDAMEAHLPE
ncbi:MAG: hypothetical protein ABR526_07505 [Chthoniobacterales bacterium]